MRPGLLLCASDRFRQWPRPWSTAPKDHRKTSRRRSTPPAPASMPPARCYDQLVELRARHHEGRAGPGRELDRQRRRQDDHLQAAQGREVPLQRNASSRRAISTPTTCCSRSSASGSRTTPMHKVSGGKYDYFADMDMPKLLEYASTRSTTTRCVMKLKEPNAPILANLAMDFASIHSAEYADIARQGRQEGAVRPGSRSAPVRSRSSPTRRTR